MKHHIHTRSPRRRYHRLIPLIALFLMGTGYLRAVTWQEILGVNDVADDDGLATIETVYGAPVGDIVTVGFTRANSGMPEIYVVRTNSSGSVQWEYVYPLTGYVWGLASDVKEFSNGDLAVVGYAATGNGYEEGIVMRLSSTGSPVWVTALSVPSIHVQPAAAVVTQIGTPDEVVIAGRTFSGPHGFIARIDGGGTLLWNVEYTPIIGGGGSAESLTGIDEARLGPGAGDIVAAGTIARFTGGADIPSDIWVMRVDGASGSASGPGHGGTIYDRAGGSETGASIRELRNGPNNGDLVVAGNASWNEVAALQLHPDPTDPTNPVADRVVGTGGAQTYSTGLCEITPGAGGNVGNIVICGATWNGGFGGSDMFFQEFQVGTMAASGAMRCAGGTSDDVARSVSPVSNGYILAGYTNSPDIIPPGHFMDIYLWKPQTPVFFYCHQGAVSLVDGPGGFSPTTPGVTAASPISDNALSLPVPVDPSLGASRFCEFKSVLPGMPGSNGGGATISALRSFPTPVPRGGSFTIGCTISAPAMVRTVVTDVVGRTIYTSENRRDDGRIEEVISTKRWGVGTYFATISAEGHMATTRVLVIDR